MAVISVELIQYCRKGKTFMSNSILYYPTIEFRPEDYQWLWNASLFADKIYRIVPPDYNLREPRNIEVLCSAGEIGIPISPIPYSRDASEEFSHFMDMNRGKAAALSLIDSDETEYIKIHSSKMDVKLLKDMFFNLKHIEDDENWLYANPNTANFYMTFLANHIAKQNSLSLWTRNQELWTTSTYFLYDGSLQNDYKSEKEFVEPSTDALVSLMISDIFPQNLLNVPPEDILHFRDKRKDERMQFLNTINHLRKELATADAPEVIRAILNDEKKKVDAAANEYKKSMEILKVIRFGGILTTAMTITADALGYCSDIPALCKDILTSAGLWVDILTGVFEKKAKSIDDNPYTYLAHITSDFSYYPGSFQICAGQPQIAMYNYTLCRGFEEFIND